MANLLSTIITGGSGTTPTLVLDRNIATPSNYYNGLQFEVRATSGTAGIGLHRNGYSHVGIYHDSTNELKFNMNSGTPVLLSSTGTIWGSGNDGAGSGLDADLTDGLHVHGGRNNEADKIVRTDSNGYIQAGWINTTSGDRASTVPNRFYGSDDDYIRYYDRPHTQMYLGLTYHYSTARRQHTTDTNYWVGTMGWGQTDWNSVGQWGSGFVDSWSSPANKPPAGGHHVGVQSFHYRNGSTAYGWQLAQGEGTGWYLRRIWGGGWSGWYEMITSENIGSQSVSYATTAGSANSVTWSNVSGKPSLDYQQEYVFTAPASTDGSGYSWVRITMGGFNSGGDFVRFSIARAIGWNGASPYGGPSMDVVAYSREWHGGQEGAVITYAEHGSVPGSGWVTNAGPRDLAGGGYWFYMRIWGGVDYAMRVYRGSGPIGTDWVETSDPGSVYKVKLGVNNIGAQHTGFTTNGQMRSDIYYDYNDEGYYGDFNSRSVLNSLQLGTASSDTTNLKLDVQGNMAIRGTNGLYFGVSTNNYNSWSTKIYASGSTQYFNGQQFIFDNQGYGSSTFVTINSGGVYTSGWFRNYGTQGMYNQDYGTHFYSSGGATWNITGSGGVVELTFRSNHQSTVRGFVYADTSNNIGFLNNAGNWSLRTDSSRNTQLYGNLTVGQDAGASSIYMYDSDEGSREIHCNSNRIGFLTQAGAWGAWLYDSADWEAASSVRAPIFYDSNDTTYYLDPNSSGTSLKINGGIVSTAGNGAVLLKHENSEANAWIFRENAANWGLFWFNAGGQSGQTIGSYTTVGAELFGMNNAVTGFNPNSAWSGTDASTRAAWMLSNYSGYLWTQGTQYSETDMRAPIFYDSNNTGYYGDFASTSVMNAIRLGTSTNSGTISGGGDWGIRFANDNGWIQFGPANNSWTHIYSDKNFYMNTHLWVSGGYKVTAWDYNNGGGALYATVFYDANDTGYYVDPNSTSYLYHLVLSGNSYFRPNTWIQFDGNYGVYWPNHYGLHLYPNTDGSYGSLQVKGIKNSWHGIHFDSGSTLMMNSGETGVHRQGVGWQWRWYNGEMYISAGSTGGGAERTVIHSGNIGSQSVNYASSAGSVEWTSVQNKPATFSPSSHTHAISDVTGLQTALDGKQASGSYAAASHTHAIADVTGLQAALDGKQAAGSYAAASHTHTFASLTSKPTTISGYGITDAITTGNIGSQSVSSASGVSITGFGDNSFTYHQTPGNVHGWTGGWASHFIGNHGNGDTYYSQSIIMPFWGVPRYQRNEGGNKVGPWQFITEENIAAQSVSFATTSGSATSATTANRLERYGIIYGNDWNSYYQNNRLLAISAHGHSGSNRPSTAYTYGSGLSYYNSGSDHYQFFFPENSGSSNAINYKIHYRSGWNGNWGGWRQLLDMAGNVAYIAGNQGTGIEVSSGVGYNQSPNTFLHLKGQGDYGAWRSLYIDLVGDASGQDIAFSRIQEGTNTKHKLWYIPKNQDLVIFEYQIQQNSDSRKKDNVSTITNAVDKVKQLRGVEFDWNSGAYEGKHDIGVIAQDVEAVLPEAVSTQEDGYKTVSYTKLIPLLIETVKEQQAMIEQLSARLSALEQK